MKTIPVIFKNLFYILFSLGLSVPASAEVDFIDSDREEVYQDLKQVVTDPVVLNDLIETRRTEMHEAEQSELFFSQKDRIIVAGDSWAMFPCLFGSMRKMLNDVGDPLRSDKRCFLTSKMGIRADQWLNSRFDRRLQRYLKNDPRIKYVYLSLGGNDMMMYWNTRSTPEQEQKLYRQIAWNLKKIMSRYAKIRPDVKVILSGYDYGRLKERNLISLYSLIFNRMMKPSPQQINHQLIRFSRVVSSLADGKNIFYIQHLGLSHYYDGVPENGLKPRVTLHPNFISSLNKPLEVGGNPEFPNGGISMFGWFRITTDAIHLSSVNYYNVMKHTYDNLLKILLKPSASLAK